MFGTCVARDVLPLTVVVLSAEMRFGFYVRGIHPFDYVTLCSCSESPDSICLIVVSLLAEAPHDVIFFWK